jgi:hypothetical protein
MSGGVDSAPFRLLSACPPGAAVLVSIPGGAGVDFAETFARVPSGVSTSDVPSDGAPTSAPAAGGAGFAGPTAGGLTGPPPAAMAWTGLNSRDVDNSMTAMVRMTASPIPIEPRQTPLFD